MQVVIVGGDEVSYSSAPRRWPQLEELMLEELGDQIDLKRVHLFGRMPHDQLQKLYRRSDLHVYLSKAFVLSWSLLELMACGTPVLAEANPMMEELIKPGGGAMVHFGGQTRATLHTPNASASNSPTTYLQQLP